MGLFNGTITFSNALLLSCILKQLTGGDESKDLNECEVLVKY